MQSVRQHQPGATLTYLMVGGLIFINQVWAPIRKRGRNSVALPPVTWRPRVDPLDQQVYLAEICQDIDMLTPIVHDSSVYDSSCFILALTSHRVIVSVVPMGARHR